MVSSLHAKYNLVIIFYMYSPPPPHKYHTKCKKSYSAEEICTVYANLLNGPTIYRKLGNANIARTYIDTDSHKLKQVKAVIIVCQISNQSATMEQNYCSSKSIF